MTNTENSIATTAPTGVDLDWVSVKDRMPKLIPIGDPPHEFVARSARVLVCGWADKEFHWSVADLRRGGQGIEDRAVRWNTDADVFWYRNHLITHWAPLSKPGEASATNGAPVSAPIDAVIVHKSTAVGWTETPRPAAANANDLLAALRAFGVTYDDEIPYNAGWFAAGSCMARATAAEAAQVALEMIEERYDTLQRDYDTVKCQVDRAYNDGLADRIPAAAQAFPDRDPSKGAYQQGLYRKFDVRRVDGSDQPEGKHCGCRYFVLDLTHDQHAPAAMRAYAAACEATHPQLAADIVAEFRHTPEAAHGFANDGREPDWDAYAAAELADEQARKGRENAEFMEWWESSGQQAAHDLTTENAAHATWQERARRAALARAPLPAQGNGFTDEQIIAALHSQGIDTYPSKYGFDAVQVSATSVPGLRKVIESLAAPAQGGDARDVGDLPGDWKLVLDEVARATRKFPTWPTDPLHAIAVLGEEFGELTKAILQTTYEPHKVADGELRTEAIQTAAMSLRLLASLEHYEFARSPQHEQGIAAIAAGKDGA